MYPHVIGIRARSRPGRSSFHHTPRWRGSWRGVKQPAQVTPGPLTHQIGIISGGANTDGLGGAAEEVAHVVRQVLEGVGGVLEGGLDLAASEDLVEDGVVMGRTSGALDGGVGLQEEVPVPGFGDATVDDGAILRVRGAVGVFFLGWVKAGIVAFADDDNRHAWQPLLGVASGIDFFARFPKERQLLVEDNVILPFGYTIAVDQEILRISAFIVIRPQTQTRFEHAIQARHHLLSSGLDLQVRRPLREPLVYRSHDACHTRGT